jgi:thiol-disulfide isomerase/thioredoxin
MWRANVAVALVLSLSSVLWAQDAAGGKKPADAATPSPAERKLLENPNDVQALTAYLNETMIAAIRLAPSDAEAATKKLEQMEEFLSNLKVDDATAKSRVAGMKLTAKSYRERFSVQNVSLDELKSKLLENPADSKAVTTFITKAQMEISSLARSKPDVAESKLKEVREVLAKVSENGAADAIKRQIASANTALTSLERSIEGAKKLTEMIGKDAAPLSVEAWVNGSPLTDADLKGKVVFLDFWAVWCGPCIATFPHLREWNEKYADKGLVMIGVTNYYKYKWDEAAKKAAPSKETVTAAEEQEMLVHFAESHDLKHRFAIESNRKLSEYYGVTGIPHVAVIDREGKIRLMKVGSGEANAKEIGDLLAELIK